MNLSLIRSMTRSAVFELENGKCFRPEHPFAVALNGKTIYESCNTNVFSPHGNSRAKAQFNQAFHRTISLEGLHGFALSTCGKHSVFCDLHRAIVKTPPITAARSTRPLYQSSSVMRRVNCGGAISAAVA